MNRTGRQANILLVDDDLNVRQALSEALAVENYDVALAASGHEALRHCQEKNPVDAVLLDLRLGDEDGWDILLRLMTLDPQLPVIIITATPDQKLPPSAPRRVALMEKPLDLPRLFEILRGFTSPRETSPLANPAASSCPELGLSSSGTPQPSTTNSSNQTYRS